MGIACYLLQLSVHLFTAGGAFLAVTLDSVTK